MDDLDNNKVLSSSITQGGLIQQLRHYLLSNPLDNLPSLFLLGVAVLGGVTLISLLFVDLFVFPFVLIAMISSFFAAWYTRILGSMRVQIKELKKQNKRLNSNLNKVEMTVKALKSNNDQLHRELNALENLRKNLQNYADKTKLDFSELLTEVNQSFKRLEVISIANERTLLQRIAQDLEFLDHKPGMQYDEYQRFIERIPEHLQASFENLANTSFEAVSGDDQSIDHKEIQALLHRIIKKTS